MSNEVERWKNKKKHSFVACGLLSGVITKTICAPFDRIRLLYQVQPMFGQYRNDSFQNGRKYKGVLRTAQKIFNEEGFRGLWRGNLANTIRGGICYATKFGMNDTTREYLKTNSILQTWLRNRAYVSSNRVRAESQNEVLVSLMAGATAGLVQKSLTYPLDLLSVRMALGVNTKHLSTSTYTGIFDCFSQILKTEGVMGFYKGFSPTMVTGVPYVALQLSFFEFYRKKMREYCSKKDSLSIKQIAFMSSLAGSAAGASALFIVFPGDTVRKRMMNNAISSENRLYRNSVCCMKYIIKNEGILAFYHGLFPSMLKSLPSGAIQFLMYEVLKHIAQTI
ncbi:mitochondrial carrier protein [Theileria orientalis]|uniref:Mitochondrial carrier protein n=1 Tax=Theileria orientalis TaxID=68886 RepID=A0A976M5S0_THEOR|nr:mitochondrial carrier protein [Theileria orientalis]